MASVGRILGTTAALAGAVHGYRKDKGNKGTKKVAKAVILGGGYSGYERARNQGQSRLAAGTKAFLGGSLYSGYKGINREGIGEKVRKYTRNEKGANRVAAGTALAGGVGTAAYLRKKKTSKSTAKKKSKN
jgi:hypothetical protein